MDALDRVTEVDRRRPGARERLAGALEAVGVSGELERDAVRRRDADQWRAADRQALDRRGHIIGAAQLELGLAPRQQRLVERPEGTVGKPQRDHRTRRRRLARLPILFERRFTA